MRTSEDLAYDKLKTMILDWELPTGKFLSQRMLAEKTNAVVITVRSSLRRLENEGLIENVPKWGVRIPEDTLEKIKDRYFMREIFELSAVQRIRGKNLLTEGLLHRLEKSAVACDRIYPDSEKSMKDFAILHAEFHLLIAEAAGSELLLGAVNRMNMRAIMFFNARRVWLKELPSALENYHQKYFKLLMHAPAAKAAEAVRAHMARGMEMELKCLEDDKIKIGQ
jgi:DNA-binding GntR family transcriptional regulator